MTGAQYVEDDGPTSLAWLITSFVLAPLMSAAAVWLVERDRGAIGKVLATVAVFPNLLLLVGTYAFIPLHPLVLALTLATLAVLLLAQKEASVGSERVPRHRTVR